jgi:hypothetical protein
MISLYQQYDRIDTLQHKTLLTLAFCLTPLSILAINICGLFNILLILAFLGIIFILIYFNFK